MAKRYTLQDWPGPNEAMPNKWATFLVSRNKQFKEHANRGHALNAIKDTYAGILYKLDEPTLQWVEVLRVEGKGSYQEACDNCGRTYGDTEELNGREYDVYVQRYWLDLDQEVPTLARFCYTCYLKAKEFGMKK